MMETHTLQPILSRSVIRRSLSARRRQVPPSSAGKVLQVFLNADMRNGHEGLAALAKENGIDVSNLHPGQYVAFINAEKNRLKVFAANNIIAYLKMPHGRIDMATIQSIPRAFQGGGSLDYDKVLREHLLQTLAKKGRQAA